MSVELESIIKGCQANDRVSQKQFYKKFYGGAMHTCIRYCSDKQDAKDVALESFMSIFLAIKTFKGTHEGAVRKWVNKVIISHAVNYHRKNSKNPLYFTNVVRNGSCELQDKDFEIPIGNDPEEESEFKYSVSEVLTALDSLSKQYRIIFNMYYFDNYEHSEIAKTLGISVGASKSSLHKAKKNLNKILER